MWVPGCFVYLSGILSTVMRWYGAETHRMTRPTSYAPIVLAAGVMLTLWGVASTWIVSACWPVRDWHRGGALGEGHST